MLSIIVSPPSSRFLELPPPPPPLPTVAMEVIPTPALLTKRDSRRCQEERDVSADERRSRDDFRRDVRDLMRQRDISVRAMADHYQFTKTLLSDFFAARNYRNDIVKALTAFRDNPEVVQPHKVAKRSRSTPAEKPREWKKIKFEINHYYEDEMFIVTDSNYLALDFLITEYETCEKLGKWAEFTVEMTAVNNRHDVAVRKFICDTQKSLESQIASFKRTLCIVTRMFNKTTGATYTRVFSSP